MIGRYLVGFFLLLLVGVTGAMGYVGHKVEQSFDTDIKAITTQYPMVQIKNYQYHKGFLTSTNDFELVLGCDTGNNGGKGEQIRLKIQNTINHIPVSSQGLRSAHIETSVLPNDDPTRKFANAAHLSTLATAVTDMDFDGGYHSTIKVPSGNAQDDTKGKANIKWDEITYKIDKQSKDNPNYSTEFHVPKIAITASDESADFTAELVNLTGKSDSEQTQQQTLPIKSDGKNHIDGITFNFKSKNDATTAVLFKLANYDETTQIRSANGLLDLTSHTQVSGDLNKIHLDSIEMDTKLTKLHYDSVNKIAEQFQKSFTQCNASSQSFEPLINTLKSTTGELSKHQPTYSFKLSVSENGNKGSLEMAQELKHLLLALQDTHPAKANPKTLIDGNRIAVDLPKVWLENLQKWLNDNNNSNAEKSAAFEKSLLAENYIKLENGHYLTNIEMKQGDIFVNGKRLEDKPTSTADTALEPDLKHDSTAMENEITTGASQDASLQTKLTDSTSR